MACAVVTFSDDDMKMRLPMGFGVSDSFFENVFGFFDELSMEIDCVRVYTAFGVVFAEDKF